VDGMITVKELCSGVVSQVEESELVFVNKDQLRYDNYDFRSETYNDCIGQEIYDSLSDAEKDWHNQKRHTPFIQGCEGDLYEVEIVDED